MKTGMVSVTFRHLKAEQIIALTKKAGLDGIEWGGDVHATDEQKASIIACDMKNAGLETLSYGSYYKAGTFSDFDKELAIAQCLNAPNIRIWAGECGSKEADKEYRTKVADDIKRIARLTQKYNISISLEYHCNTLTDTQASTILLLKEAGMNNVCTYWQPPANISHEENLASLKELIAMEKLKNIHAFHWTGYERLAFEDGINLWNDYINLARNACNAILLEFVKQDNEEQFLSDAGALRRYENLIHPKSM